MLTKEELKNKFTSALIEVSRDGVDIERVSQSKAMLAIYLRMFNETPQFVATDYNCFYEGKESEEESPYFDMDPYRTMIAIEEAYKDTMYSIRVFDSRLLIGDHLLLTCDDDSLYGCYSEKFFPKEFEQYIVKSTEEGTRSMSYVTSSGNGFNTMSMDVNKTECDLEANYNDDLPIDTIKEFIESPDAGLVIMYGKPGTGKTTLLRHLIYSTKKKFIFLDSSCFNYITDATFVKLLINNKDSIVVLEDCEDLLKDRNLGNSKLSSLLNLSDGILGDSLNLKFICTFNAQLKNIDEAVTRPGRLKLKYEFKPLTAEKTQVLASKLGKEIPEGKSLPICEIYNYGEDNGAIFASSKRGIGFG